MCCAKTKLMITDGNLEGQQGEATQAKEPVRTSQPSTTGRGHSGAFGVAAGCDKPCGGYVYASKLQLDYKDPPRALGQTKGEWSERCRVVPELSPKVDAESREASTPCWAGPSDERPMSSFRGGGVSGWPSTTEIGRKASISNFY